LNRRASDALVEPTAQRHASSSREELAVRADAGGRGEEKRDVRMVVRPPAFPRVAFSREEEETAACPRRNKSSRDGGWSGSAWSNKFSTAFSTKWSTKLSCASPPLVAASSLERAGAARVSKRIFVKVRILFSSPSPKDYLELRRGKEYKKTTASALARQP
jgi:hypothetical protein